MSLDTLKELEDAAKGLDAASTKLSRLTKDFEGPEGVGTRYRIAIEDARINLYDDAIKGERRPPAQDVRDAKAERHVRLTDPELYSDFTQLETEITALKLWISSKKASISARQSVLSAEKALA